MRKQHNRRIFAGFYKRYIGVRGKEEFNILKEDLAFLNDCLKTVLKSYSAYFRERYIEGKSVRKYAEAHNLNRGVWITLTENLLRNLPPPSKQGTMRTACAAYVKSK